MTTNLKSEARYKLFKAPFEVAKEQGFKEVYRHKALKQYSSIVRDYDPTHNDKTRGDHVDEWLQRVATELNGDLVKDTNKNGNTKKNSVRIVFRRNSGE